MSDDLPAKARAKRPLLFPSRIVLLVVLAVAVGAMIVDQRARAEAQKAYTAVHQALGDERSLVELPPKEVHRLIGREPDADDDPADRREQFSWQGGLFKQTIYVVYWPGKEPLLKDVSLNEPLD